MKVLALETSTSNIKALLYDNVSGTRMTREKHIPGEIIRDGALYDPDRLAFDMLALGRTVLEENRSVPDVISVSVSWHSLLLCDREMRPQSPVYLWTFRGAHPVTDRIRKDEEKAAALYRRTGAIVHPSYPRYKLEWLRETGISFDGLRIIGLGTYLTWKLTGTVAALPAMAAGSGLYLIEKPAWDKEELEHLGIDPAQLPELSDFHTTFPLGHEAADLLGVPEGIPCTLAGPDGGLDQLGADAMEPGIMTVTVGTSGSLLVRAGDTQRPTFHLVLPVARRRLAFRDRYERRHELCGLGKREILPEEEFPGDRKDALPLRRRFGRPRGTVPRDLRRGRTAGVHYTGPGPGGHAGRML